MKILIILSVTVFFGCSSIKESQKDQDQAYLHEPDLDPQEHTLYLDEYFPVSMLRVPVNVVLTPKYPAIDIHTHLTPNGYSRLGADDTPEKVIAKMDEYGLRAVINLNGGYGETLDAVLEQYREYSDRILTFARIDFSGINDPDFGENQRQFLHDAVTRGVRGIKISKALGLRIRDGSGEHLRIDDHRLDPIWETCGELGIPVLIHSADPAAFFELIDHRNERYEQLQRHPDWSFYGEEFPDRDSVLNQRDNMIRKHQNTVFIGAHMGDNSEDLRALGRRLDEMPNFYVDMSARVAELGRQPYTSREFFITYQDRILFGTDRSPTVIKQPRHQIYYRFLETRDEYFDYYKVPRPPTGSWKIYGIHLPDNVLKKVYYKNAERIIPGL